MWNAREHCLLGMQSVSVYGILPRARILWARLMDTVEEGADTAQAFSSVSTTV